MTDKTLISTILLSLTLWSCQDTSVDNNNIETNDTQELEWTMPLLLDTFNFKTTTKIKDEFGVATFYPLYFGHVKDTLFVNYKIRPYPPPPPTIIGDSIIEPENKYDNYPKVDHEGYDDYFPVYASKRCIHWDSTSIEIRIDTTQTIRNIDFEVLQDSTFAFKAYPVLLTNKNEKTVIVGYGTHVAIIMEAKDESGKWRPIERHYTYMCGTGLPDIVLPPNESVLTSAKIYQGCFKTDIRLRIGDNVSEPFKGSINLTQFKKE